jgi:thiol-disulfide isomerase/thioredoxin
MNAIKLKKSIFVSLCILALNLGFFNSASAQINFEHGSWTEIKAKAKAEHKLIFMDAFTTWCGPCKWMAKNVFTNDTVAAYYNATFVNAKIDMEAGEGKDIATLYGVRVYPSLLFIDADGELLHRSAGSRGAADFILLGKDAQNPDKQFATLDKKYKGGQRDPGFLRLYIAALQGVALPVNEPLAAYFSSQKEADLINRENWTMISTYLTDSKSKEFSYLLKNADAFAKKYTKDSVNDKISAIYNNECYELIHSTKADSAQYFALRNEIRKSGFAKAEEGLIASDIYYYQTRHDMGNYAKSVTEFIEKYESANAGALNNYAYEFYTNIKDKAMLAKAEKWAQKAYELEPDPQVTMDTYACVLSVNGKKAEAVKLEKEAIALIKANPKKYDQNAIADMEKKISDWSAK